MHMRLPSTTQGYDVFEDYVAPSQEGDLLEFLKGYPFLAHYNMHLYCDDGEQRKGAPRFRICGLLEQNRVPTYLWQSSVEEALIRVHTEGKPVALRSETGLLSFTVPLKDAGHPEYYLFGYGVREKSINLWQMEIVARNDHTDPFTLLEEVEKLPTTTLQEVENVAQRIKELLPSILPQDKQTEQTLGADKLEAIVGVSAEIDILESTEEVISLLSETLGILFDAPRIAFVFPDQNNRTCVVQGIWGLPETIATLPYNKVCGYIPSSPNKTFTMVGAEMKALLPGVSARNAFCIPLTVGPQLLGMVMLLDMEVHPQTALMIQLLSGRVGMKLMQLRREEELSQENSLSRKMMSMVSVLSLTESQDELYRNILDMATNLLRASSGSLMLLDQTGENLKIEAVKGMNQQLARTMNIKAKNGISGKVLTTGNPLLVNDIENDFRIGYPNRPRFKTKSFISYPLKLRETTIGVINVSDKEHNAIFTEEDLKLLESFISQAAVIIERSRSIERTSMLERLSVTDPLTGLYNRRFQGRRMEEELSRSSRQGLSLTVMLIDLDNFKMYNDLCGHVAGDRALKKVADILRESVREMDVVTRYGGEEFCVILPSTSKKESLFVAERIRREVESEGFPGEENLPRRSLTASIGIASYPEDGNSTTALINSADIALYRAKAEGRNRIIMFTNSLQQEKEKQNHLPMDSLTLQPQS